ncbi:MAG TPA: patatin-like phospholipase family protein [Mucilaginibacter sp.]|jgi:hypothetical protein|nr:patatin-like phospholipase family protein [Mucilaginibacter sp.]
MDVVTDLTSQTVAYLTLIQDMYKSAIDSDTKASLQNVPLWELRDMKFTAGDVMKHPKNIQSLVWYGQLQKETPTLTFHRIAVKLLKWLSSNYNLAIVAGSIHKQSGDGTLYCTPYQWRRIIRSILYKNPETRLSLAEAIHYMPVQVVFALGGKGVSAFRQRLYQVWDPNDTFKFLTKEDYDENKKWWKGKTANAKKLLTDDTALITELLSPKIAIAVPFETFFNKELDEIALSRTARQRDERRDLEMPVQPLSTECPQDPIDRAQNMDLYALAFSGGGIRSATFNLGVLQKLAEKNMLSRIDYLSTVSGGGYIGTWFASWIKRCGSVAKVTQRLDTRLSGDPQGEEVRPVRWLRMFSNYLSPNASLMSADSWTMGITWLRNTVINQVILLLLVCTGLSVVESVFYGWNYLASLPNAFNDFKVLFYSIAIFGPASVMAGMGMQLYCKQLSERSWLRFVSKPWFSIVLVGWAVLISILISAWFYNDKTEDITVFERSRVLIWAGVTGFAAMLVIAYIGYYRSCAQRMIEKKWIDIAIIGSSLIASAAGLFMLALIWALFQYVHEYIDEVYFNPTRVVFIVGPPLILEAISISVVIRMALMGRLFPDERREWWGRMGAITHRFMFFWLLISIGALILPDEFHNLRKSKVFAHIPVLLGGWTAIIGWAVKLAYQSKDPSAKPGSRIGITEIFIRVAPYLFMVGFLLIASATLHYIDEHVVMLSLTPFAWTPALVALVLGILTLFFSWRVGVNEFSLHHFYRNRLVRAYLGATRLRKSRDRTSNSFTGFDKKDDLKLSRFITAEGYIGPYPLLNTTLNATQVSQLDRQDRKGESFIFSPMYCGYDFSPTRSADYVKDQVFEYGYRQTMDYAYENGPMIGTAMAISGAAVNPNMGYHSAPATAFMLTIFNVRLGWWIGNTRRKNWKRSDPQLGITYLVSDLVGDSNIDSDYVCLSDGGHFDNMGLYELIRRRCMHIILCDAEEDVDAICEGLANAIRRCRIDFGVDIRIDTGGITTKDDKTKFSKVHVAKGTITYPGQEKQGELTYIKTTLTGDEPTDVREYHLNNTLFPQQSTGDQFFNEEQFESYRQLGYHSIDF